jgi:hypothetical protein
MRSAWEEAAAFRPQNTIGVEGAAAFRLLKKFTSKSKGLQARRTSRTRNNIHISGCHPDVP